MGSARRHYSPAAEQRRGGGGAGRSHYSPAAEQRRGSGRAECGERRVRSVSEVGAGAALAFAREVVERIGARPGDAERTAELLVRAEVGGHPSHGLRRLVQYADGWRAGTIAPSATAVIE